MRQNELQSPRALVYILSKCFKFEMQGKFRWFTDKLALVLFQELKKMWSSSYLLIICFTLEYTLAQHWEVLVFHHWVNEFYFAAKRTYCRTRTFFRWLRDLLLTCVCVRVCVHDCVLSGKWEDSRQLLLIRCGFRLWLANLLRII